MERVKEGKSEDENTHWLLRLPFCLPLSDEYGINRAVGENRLSAYCHHSGGSSAKRGGEPGGCLHVPLRSDKVHVRKEGRKGALSGCSRYIDVFTYFD